VKCFIYLTFLESLCMDGLTWIMMHIEHWFNFNIWCLATLTQVRCYALLCHTTWSPPRFKGFWLKILDFTKILLLSCHKLFCNLYACGLVVTMHLNNLLVFQWFSWSIVTLLSGHLVFVGNKYGFFFILKT
jgi:hypothetical protein